MQIHRLNDFQSYMIDERHSRLAWDFNPHAGCLQPNTVAALDTVAEQTSLA